MIESDCSNIDFQPAIFIQHYNNIDLTKQTLSMPVINSFDSYLLKRD